MESFDIGRTLSRTFSLAFGTIASVGLFILILQIISGAAQYVLQGYWMGELTAAQQGSDPDAAMAIFGSGAYWGTIILSYVVASLMFAGATHGYLKAANDEAVSIGDCFTAGISKLLPVLGLMILWFLGVSVGFMLVIIPGLILMTMWSTTIPALVGEKLGVFGSFGRSRALTRGSRLKIFLLLLIFLVLIYVVMFVILGALMGGAIMGGGLTAGTTISETTVWTTLGMIPVGWLMSALLTALLVSIYHECVAIKEGGAPEKLTEVFE